MYVGLPNVWNFSPLIFENYNRLFQVVEVCGVLGEPRSAVPCGHDVTRSMCYLCSPQPEDKGEIWNEIQQWHTPANVTRTWHTPTVVPTVSTSVVEPPTFVDEPESVLESIVDPPRHGVDVGVGTESQPFTARNVVSVDQSTQTARHYPCKYCPALFSDVMHLVHHKTVHQKMLECVFCSAHFVGKNDLRSHMKLHMLPKHYECVYCTQSFTKKHDIKCHLALHAEQKLFHCLACPAIFTQKNLLRHHEKSHSVSKFIHYFKKINDETVVESRISPDSANTSTAESASTFEKSNNSAPESIPAEEQPPVVEPETFVNASTSIQSLNFFNCETCPLSFKSLNTYKTHRRCHTRKDGNFVCTFCSGRFKKKTGLVRHTRATHTVA